jgi:hypothetical protein
MTVETSSFSVLQFSRRLRRRRLTLNILESLAVGA